VWHYNLIHASSPFVFSLFFREVCVLLPWSASVCDSAISVSCVAEIIGMLRLVAFLNSLLGLHGGPYGDSL
jgi:hypothetical protein